ncbi:MAG: ABC transporter ATP-binding protein [Cyanobium sp. MAG_185]|jgi:lipopolysaccharide transport system ATP-binding protein|nr:ABC transporter ATP-binding protein [Cyanobium sp. MAG_185]
MSSDLDQSLALRVSHLSKCYSIYNHPRDRLLQAIWGHRKKLFRAFWALEDVSFELRKGQTLGIVGRNGSGKSTLLQMICGTLTPTSGSVQVPGRIGALLELGSGFNPEFSGLENVYLNAALLGLTKRETETRLDAILAFADIGSFIDQPVKTYSSGMAVRLAFAVQAHVEPDLLVVDEALAVGDEMFQKKCYSHLEGLKQRGTAILLVTHSCPQILQHCDEALLVHGGRLRLMGAPKTVTSAYQRLCNAPADQWENLLQNLSETSLDAGANESSSAPEKKGLEDSDLDPHLIPSSSISYEAHGIHIDHVQVLNSRGEPANLLPMGEPFSLRFNYSAQQSFSALKFACNIANNTGVRITGQHHPGPDCQAGDSFSMVFQFQGGLLPGLYFVGGGIWAEADPGIFLHRVVDCCALRITAEAAPSSFGLCNLSAGPPRLEAAR